MSAEYWPRYSVRPAVLVAKMRAEGRSEAEIDQVFHAGSRPQGRKPLAPSAGPTDKR